MIAKVTSLKPPTSAGDCEIASVEKGGDWTLQRLILETEPLREEVDFLRVPAPQSAGGVEVILETKVDALDITVLKGGGDEVGQWAIDHGFRLPPDAPEVLDFYAERSPIFLAAAFDAHPGSREHWDAFPPSARKLMLTWIVTAKRPPTRAARVDEVAARAAIGERART